MNETSLGKICIKCGWLSDGDIKNSCTRPGRHMFPKLGAAVEDSCIHGSIPLDREDFTKASQTLSHQVEQLTTEEKPWWWPQLTDASWCERIRQDYTEPSASWDDDMVRSWYANGRKYATLWDHVGDAQEQFEELADAFLSMMDAVNAVERSTKL